MDSKERQEKIQEIKVAIAEFSTEMFAKMVKKLDEGKDNWQDKKRKLDFIDDLENNLDECDYIDVANFAMFLHRFQK